MTRLVLVRHGQTEWNRVERFRGRADVPLNETGHRQAQAAAGRIAGTWTVQAIYYSTLARAGSTAQAIATACNAPAIPEPDLLDIDYGAWTGQSPDEVAGHAAELLKRWYTQPQTVHIPNGESLDAVRRRAAACMDRLAARHAAPLLANPSTLSVAQPSSSAGPVSSRAGGPAYATAPRQAEQAETPQTIVLVSHLVVCRLLVLAALGLDSSHFWRIQQETATLNVFEWHNGVYKIVAINDACHLAGV